MAECLFCKKNNGYKSYRDGGCKHVDNVEFDEHSICKYFEFVSEEKARNILAEQPERQENYNYLKKYKGKEGMKGIVLAGGSGSRLWPITKGTSKQLLPIYDKPMIYFPVSTLMLAGIQDILIITTPQDQNAFKALLGDGSSFGIRLSYAVQPSPDGLAQAFIIANDCGFLSNEEPCALILGDNIFHGPGFTEKLIRASKMYAETGKATIFGTPVKDPQRYGIAEVDKDGKVVSIEEKPKEPKSNICVTGLYFYPAGVVEVARNVKPSARGELEITSVNQAYLEIGKLRLENLGLGFAWLDTGTFDSLSEASNYVETIEKRTGQQIACLEEIAYNNHWIDKLQLLKSANEMIKNEYGQYLLQLSKNDDEKPVN
jgi:glucose-1-phosphate thymidylyltransferase